MAVCALMFSKPVFRMPVSRMPMRWILGMLVWGSFASALGTPAVAQEPASVPAEEETANSDRRSAMYASLSREVAEFERQGNILKTVVKLVGPTVVHIEAEKEERTYGASRRVEEAGSGVIVEMKGKYYVLTNRHVIKDARLAEIQINMADNRQIHPLKVWSDAGTDIAVMAINTERLVAARLGDSSKVEIGDFVLAVGSPFGLSQSVTYGIISAKGRRDLELGDDGVKYQDFFQTDAAINPGNSGGPLISLRGEVIGINAAIASNHGGNEGVGFTIPINMVMSVARQLVENGEVVRAFLGVRLDHDFTSQTATRLGLPGRQGALITGITPGTPAESAKLSVNDVVLQFNQVAVEDDDHLINMVGLTEVGTEIPVTVLRNRERIQLKVRVGDRSHFEQ